VTTTSALDVTRSTTCTRAPGGSPSVVASTIALLVVGSALTTISTTGAVMCLLVSG
jgi:hypothetical protein